MTEALSRVSFSGTVRRLVAVGLYRLAESNEVPSLGVTPPPARFGIPGAVGLAALVAALLIGVLTAGVTMQLITLDRAVRRAEPGTPFSQLADNLEDARTGPLAGWPGLRPRLAALVTEIHQAQLELHVLHEQYELTRLHVSMIDVPGRPALAHPTSPMTAFLAATQRPLVRGSLSFREAQDAIRPYLITPDPSLRLGCTLVETPPGHLLAIEVTGQAAIVAETGTSFTLPMTQDAEVTTAMLRAEDRTVVDTLPSMQLADLPATLEFPGGPRFRLAFDPTTRNRFPDLPPLSSSALAEGS